VLAQFVADYRYSRGGYDMLAARGLAASAGAPAAEAEPGAAFRVVAGGAKPVRRGADWVLKAPGGTLTVTPAEAEAATWLLARPDVTEAELAARAPSVEAPALLSRLAEAGLLVPAS